MLKLIFALIAVAVAVPAGGLLAGVDRRLTARLQSRQGPPLLQPYYDVRKLFEKERASVNSVESVYVGAALLFALFRALSNVYTGIDLLVALNLPSTVYNMFPYIISLVVLVFVSKKSRAPKAEGIPYDKGQR